MLGFYSVARGAVRIIVPTLFVVAVWEAVCAWGIVDLALLPRPWSVALALLDLLDSWVLANDIAWSLRRAFMGVVLGGTIGLVTGTITGRIRWLDWLLVPILNGARAVPPVAIVPLVVVWVGLGESAKVFVTSWAAFFPVWLNTHAGVSAVDKLTIWVGRSLGAERARLLFCVTLPAAMSQILVGFRLALSSVLICVIVAEMTGADVGLGYRLYSAYLVFRIDRMLACLVVLSLLGSVTDRIFTVLTARIFPWLAMARDSG